MKSYLVAVATILTSILTSCGGATSSTTQMDAGKDSAPEGSNSACGATSVMGLTLATVSGFNILDPLGYAPFAAEGCTVVYVSADGSLKKRDLASGTEMELAPASEKPRRPTLAGNVIAWETVQNGATAVRVRDASNMTTTIISMQFLNAGEPRATSDAVAFTGWLGPNDSSDTDIFIYSIADHGLTRISSPAQQRFADIDASRVAYADFGEGGPTGAFDINMYTPADMVVADRATLTKTTRILPGKQAFPMLVTGDAVAYLDWGLIHPEPKFSEYNLMVGPISGNPTADVNVANGAIHNTTPYVRPMIQRGATFEWLADSNLWRRPADLSKSPTQATSAQVVVGTVPTDTMSLIAVVQQMGASLEGVAR